MSDEDRTPPGELPPERPQDGKREGGTDGSGSGAQGTPKQSGAAEPEKPDVTGGKPQPEAGQRPDAGTEAGTGEPAGGPARASSRPDGDRHDGGQDEGDQDRGNGSPRPQARPEREPEQPPEPGRPAGPAGEPPRTPPPQSPAEPRPEQQPAALPEPLPRMRPEGGRAGDGPERQGDSAARRPVPGAGARDRDEAGRIHLEKPAGMGAEAEDAAHDAADGGPGESEQEPAPGSTGRRRLAEAVWPPRVTRAQLIVALLLFVLGLGLAIQVRSTSENSALRGARQEDLVRILDELDDRTKRLEDEKRSLERQQTELENSSDQAEEARKQTQKKQRQLGVLAGTVKARGPGIALTVSDPAGAVEADMLLDTVQELRAAGAEAIEVNDVRVVASTYFSDSGGGVSVDGRRITQPYRFEVIGKPQDLEPALNIPGGVAQTLRKEQADVSVTRSEQITVDAVRSAKKPQYADPSSQ